MTAAEPIVEMHDISISFPGVKALDSVDFRMFPGEVHTLMGENGAGKSTLIKALTGVYQIDSGTIVVGGQRRQFQGTGDAQDAGVATVYQEVNLCPNLTIGENVMLGREVRGRVGINWKATHRAAAEALTRLGLADLDPTRPLGSLSLAVQQLVAITRGTVFEPTVLVLDEPTSSLDANEVEQLFGVIRGLRDRGVAILFVSHFLDQVYEISDRITILRNGQFQGEHLTAELDRSTLISTMIGKDLATLRSLDAQRAQREHVEDARPVVRTRGLGRAGGITPTDLELQRGEVVGVAGLLGSGRTELARLLYGADKADAGTLEIDGRSVTLTSPAVGLRHGLAYSTENRRDEGIIADLSVRENIILAIQAQRGWLRPVPRKEQDRLAERYITTLNIRPADADRPIKNLSGGNQQKVLLGRWLATKPDVLILDEPTRGIDVGAKAEIQEHVLELASEGMGLVFISSELEEVVRLSERILVLKDREKIAEIENGADVTAETIVATIAGHDQNAEVVA